MLININDEKGELKMHINMYNHIYELYKEAECYKYNMMCSNVFDYKIFYRNSLNEKLREIINLLENNYDIPSNSPFKVRDFRQQEFTLEELSKYNGIRGNPPYVSVNGIIYDLSSVQSWDGGVHFGIVAGSDATNNFNTCHGASKILDTIPKVGILKLT